MQKQTLTNQIDQLVYQAVFDSDLKKQAARHEIWQQATSKGIIPASINDFYLAQGAEKISKKITTPAFNLRGMTYDTARAAFSAAKKNKVGALIFEIARSEMDYTAQNPDEYVSVLLAAALRENWLGPIFVQGDHYQAKASSPGIPNQGEIGIIKQLITDSIKAGFYNIDIDMSTLVDLTKETEVEQQEPNIKYSVELAQFIRSQEPKGIAVSIGGEIGHIGGKNSTLADFNAYIQGFNQAFGNKQVGLSKISVQTGTQHGGVVLRDGSLAQLDVDFGVLEKITLEARKKYQIGGSVQHGASTLPDNFFHQFVKAQALEVHFATGIQNLIMDHPAFPQKLLEKIYSWLDQTQLDEKEENQTSAQFHYKLRKKAWGKFKQETWDIPEATKIKIRTDLEKKFAFYFKQLNTANSLDLINQYIKPVIIKKTLADFAIKKQALGNIKGLAD